MTRFLSLLCASAAMLCACSPRPAVSTSPSPAPGRAGHGPWLHISGHGTAKQPVHIVLQQGNRKEYAGIARSYESNGAQGNAISTFFAVHITFFGKDGTKLVAEAPQAIVDEASNIILLTNRVHAKTGSGMTLDCDRLSYDRNTEMIHGEGHVVMENGHGIRVTGNRVDSDITLTRARLQ